MARHDTVADRCLDDLVAGRGYPADAGGLDTNHLDRPITSPSLESYKSWLSSWEREGDVRTRSWAIVAAIGITAGAMASGQPTATRMAPRDEPPLLLDQATAPLFLTAGRGVIRRRLRPSHDPYPLVSPDSLLATLRELTSIQRTTMWRTAGSRGEAEARTYVKHRLAALPWLNRCGMWVEEQPFRTLVAGDIWQAGVVVTLPSGDVTIPAQGLQGSREVLDLTLRFDSDGLPNDLNPNPVTRRGPPVLIRTQAQLHALSASLARNRVVLLDYAVVDRAILGTQPAAQLAGELLSKTPAGVILVTTFSNQPGVSHGSFAGDLSAFTSLATVPTAPTVFVRLEDVISSGVEGWNGLAAASQVALTWDADVYTPGHSANIIAHIPGHDRTRALILGAHLDSANSPGALDDGSGSAVLLEVATTIDASSATPPVDLLLAWFGSHERGLYGSASFVVANSELLDRTVAMLQTDCLSRPLDGIEGRLLAETWSYSRFGDASLPWPVYLQDAAARHGISPEPYEVNGLVSDNSSFAGLDVPNLNHILIPWTTGEVHYSGHLHDPYDDLDLATEQVDTLADMATVALTAAFATGTDLPELRITPPPVRRAVLVASHTEPPQMSPAGLVELGMALAWEGLDVDTVPFGQAVTAADLDDAAVVVALPALSYTPGEAATTPAGVSWSAQEATVLQDYVADGGLLVLTASANRLRYGNGVCEPNQLRDQASTIGSSFGITFGTSPLAASLAVVATPHPILAGVATLELATNNALPIAAAAGQTLARAASQPVMVLVPAAPGEVLVLGDLGLLGTAQAQAPNLTFWQNLAHYAVLRE